MMSPGSRCSTSFSIVSSTNAAGTMIHTARGCSSLPTNSSMEYAPVAPSPASCVDGRLAHVVDDALVAVTHQAGARGWRPSGRGRSCRVASLLPSSSQLPQLARRRRVYAPGGRTSRVKRSIGQEAHASRTRARLSSLVNATAGWSGASVHARPHRAPTRRRADDRPVERRREAEVDDAVRVERPRRPRPARRRPGRGGGCRSRVEQRVGVDGARRRRPSPRRSGSRRSRRARATRRSSAVVTSRTSTPSRIVAVTGPGDRTTNIGWPTSCQPRADEVGQRPHREQERGAVGGRRRRSRRCVSSTGSSALVTGRSSTAMLL